MADTVSELASWCAEYLGDPLDLDLVPGTTDSERQCLAALGGLARQLCGETIEGWPEPVRSWADRGPILPQDLVDRVRAEITRGRDGAVLGRLYERLVRARNRRRLGTFFTPSSVVTFLLDRAQDIMGVPDTVVDPGAGVGAITFAAAQRWPDASVYAVDVNVVTLGLLGIGSAVLHLDRVQLIYADYIDWIYRSRAGNARLIIGNPPYTRHQELPKEDKERYASVSGGLVDNRQASLSAYFLASSTRALGANDSLIFVLPGNWTEAKYGSRLRKHIFEDRFRRRELYAFPTGSTVFPGTNVTTMVMAIGPQRQTPQPLSLGRVRLNDGAVSHHSVEDAENLISNPEALGRRLWTNISHPQSQCSEERVIPLRAIAHVRRGVASGAAEFFFMTKDQRDSLPVAATTRAVLHLRDVRGSILDEAAHAAMGVDGFPCWLLQLRDGRLLKDPRILALISKGEALGLPSRTLLRRRTHWFEVEKVPPPDIMIGSMGKRGFRAVVNSIGAIPSNSIYGIYLSAERSVAARLVDWLNSPNGQQALESVARHYSADLHKLEPRALLDIRIPADIAGDYHRCPNARQLTLDRTDAERPALSG